LPVAGVFLHHLDLQQVLLLIRLFFPVFFSILRHWQVSHCVAANPEFVMGFDHQRMLLVLLRCCCSYLRLLKKQKLKKHKKMLRGLKSFSFLLFFLSDTKKGEPWFSFLTFSFLLLRILFATDFTD